VTGLEMLGAAWAATVLTLGAAVWRADRRARRFDTHAEQALEVASRRRHPTEGPRYSCQLCDRPVWDPETHFALCHRPRPVGVEDREDWA